MWKYVYAGLAIVFLSAGLFGGKAVTPEINSEALEEKGVLSCAMGSKSTSMHVMRWHYYTTGFAAPYGVVGVCGSGNVEIGKKIALRWVNIPSFKVRYIISIRDMQTNQYYVTEPVQRAKIAAFAADFKIYRILLFVISLIFLCMTLLEWRKK